jgi:spore maturation protein SpmB
MIEIADIILQSGRAAVELALFVLLPVMIVMLTLMRLLEAKHLLDYIVRTVSPLLHPLGVPGLGIFALLQVFLVSFAAPLATLAIMDKSGTSRRHIAATLAMIFTAAQANVVFPMAAFGLHVGSTLLIALFASLFSAAVTYHVFARHFSNDTEPATGAGHPVTKHGTGLLNIINRAGREAFDLAIGALPMLVLALVLVNSLRALGVIEQLESVLAPLMSGINYPSVAVLPIVSKYIAGGTAMMGVSIEYLQQGLISITEFNRMAGFLIHPFDLAGIAILLSAGPRVASVFKPALYGALVGILTRTLLHSIWF